VVPKSKSKWQKWTNTGATTKLHEQNTNSLITVQRSLPDIGSVVVVKDLWLDDKDEDLQAQGQGLEVHGQGLVNWSSRTDFPRGPQHWIQAHKRSQQRTTL